MKNVKCMALRNVEANVGKTQVLSPKKLEAA